MSETLTIPLNSVYEWLEQETVSLFDPIRAEAEKLLQDIQSRLGDLTDSCTKLLEDAGKEVDKRNRKTYQRAKFLYKLAENFIDLIENITSPEVISEKNLMEFSEEIKNMLKTIDQERTKWFKAISPYFILSRRRFDATLKRVDDSFQIFNNFIIEDYNKVGNAESVKTKVSELQDYLTELEKYEKGKKARIQKKDNLEKKIIKSGQKLQDIQCNNEVVELAQTNLKINELTKTIKHELRHIQKPLLKFQTLVNNPGYSLIPDANLKLEEYLNDPFLALATEKEGYPLLRIILQKIDAALDNKKLKLKSSRFRKAKNQIIHIAQKSGLEELQKECIIFYNKKQKLVNSSTINEIKDEKTELNNSLNDLKRKMNFLETRDSMIEKKHNIAKKRVNEQKTDLEKIVSELSSKKIQILLD